MKFNSTSFFRVFFSTRLKSLITAAFFITQIQNGFSQITGMNYTWSSITYGWGANGGTVLAGSPGADDQVFSFVPTWSGFNYAGIDYPAGTTIYVSSNGWISFVNPGVNSRPVNSLATTPGIIAPWWDDLKIAAAGSINWKVLNASPNRRVIIEWNQILWDHNATTWALSMQLSLCEKTSNPVIQTPNSFEFKYLQNGPLATNYNPGSGGASAGFSGWCSGDYYSYSNPPGASGPIKISENSTMSNKPNPVNHKFAPTAHPNDECATAFALPNLNPSVALQSYQATTIFTTPSAGNPSCGPAATYNDAWFTINKPANITNFEIFTDSLDCRGTNYRPGIEVFTSCGGAPLACDYGSAGPAGTNATSYINLTGLPCALTQYWIRIFNTDSTNESYFRLNIRPPGRNCTYANNITGCALPYNSPPNLSTCGFINDYDSLSAACHSRVQHGEDYVFSYTPAANQCVNFTLNGTAANSNPGLFIYANGCPQSGSEVCYGNVASAGGSPLQFNNVSLTAGQTYYFVVDYDSSGAVPCLSNFSLSIIDLGSSPPTNDVCAGAQNVPITIASACVGSIDYNNNCATPSASGTVPLPGCASFTDGITPDVWFSFTSNAVVTGPYQTNVDVGSAPAAQDLAMAIYSGGCGGLVLVAGACDDNSNGLMPSLSFTPNPSTTYYIRIWSNNGTKPGNFRICVLSGCTPPNDLCTGVITLQNGQPLLGDNGCSTGTAEPMGGTSASCWTNSGGAGQLHTVWYNFVATNTQMRIRLRLLTMFDSQMALYSSSTGTCAGVFTQIFCNDNGPNTCGSGGTIRWSEITATGLTVGNTYFLRVDGYNANTGTFELTLVEGSNPFPPINTQDCALAQSICSGSNMTVADPGYQGTGNICDMPNGGSTCMAAGERGASWYTWSVNGGAAGQYMNFIINPNAPNDYDFILYCVDTFNTATGGDGIPAIANYCSQLTNANAFPAVACNWSACGNTGCNQSAGTLNIPGGIYNGGAGAPCIIPAIFVPAGMTAVFLLQASNYTTSTSGFTLNFQGTPINSTPPSMIWTGAANTTTWSTVTNWNPSNCGNVPSCANLIPAYIGTGAYQPTLVANTNVKDLTINPGANLTIAPGVTLQICGNFTNNGTLTCGTGANITFIGNANQSINGTFAAASNQFYNLIVSKSGGTLTFNTNIYCQGNFNVNAGIVNFNSKNLEIGGNFYNYNGPTSITGLGSGVGGTTITFTRRSTVNQLYQNDVANLTLNNVSMRQLVAGGTLTLVNNATSDLIIGSNGVLSMGTGGFGQEGVIVTPAGSTREVNVINKAPAACNAGCPTSYVSGKLRRGIGTTASSYDFPVGDLAKGYELANVTYTTAPTAAFNILSQFKIWGGSNCPFPAGNGPAASECVTATYNALPYFNHGYWNMDGGLPTPQTIIITVGQGGTMSFNPSSFTVNVGDTIRYVWASGFHNVHITSPVNTTSPNLTAAGNSWDYIPLVSGVYNYQCDYHVASGMTGSFTANAVGAPSGVYNFTGYNTGYTNNSGMGWTVVKAASNSCAFALSGNCYAPSTANITRRDALSGFSDFAIVQSQNPLPIELLTFDAKTNNSGVLCSWVTASEINNDHFEIERSKDGKNFTMIGEMKGFGAGTSLHNMEYKYQDEDICAGVVFYRLKQVDIDGHYTYSDVVAVTCKNDLLNIAPNPAMNEVNLNFYETQKGNVTIHVTDIIGQVIMMKKVSVEKGYNDMAIDISSLSSGVYYLKIINAESHPNDVDRQIKFLKY